MSRLHGVALATAVLCCSCARKPQQASNPVRITQFYASGANLPRGQKALLCYGVENAVTVKIAPPVEELRPSFTRCFNVAPETTTTYTLTAEDAAGNKVTQDTTINVTEPAPEFTDLSISSQQVKPGDMVAFCFKAKNAVKVSGKPGSFQHGGTPAGDCLVHQPRQPTEYQLTLHGHEGTTVTKDIKVNIKTP